MANSGGGMNRKKGQQVVCDLLRRMKNLYDNHKTKKRCLIVYLLKPPSLDDSASDDNIVVKPP